MTPRVRQVVIGAATALAAGLVVAAVVVARSGDDDAAPASTTTEAPTTTATTATAAPASAVGTLPPTVATTARPAPTSTVAVATTPAGTTTSATAATTTSASAATTAAPVVSGGTSTTDPDAAPAFPCEAAGLLAAFRAAQPLPAGARLDDVRCYGAYAGGVISSQGANRAFAVFGASPTAWQLLNVGSAFVCQPLEIPDPAYTTIGCPAWDN